MSVIFTDQLKHILYLNLLYWLLIHLSFIYVYGVRTLTTLCKFKTRVLSQAELGQCPGDGDHW